MRLWDTPVPIPNTMVKTQAADGTLLETVRESRWMPESWGFSSVGRAPALQAGGHEFESRNLHEDFLKAQTMVWMADKLACRSRKRASDAFAKCP